MTGGLHAPAVSPEHDEEVQLDVGTHSLEMLRAIAMGKYQVPGGPAFGLRHVSCDGSVDYRRDADDPPNSSWVCGGCSVHVARLFRDLELETMSLVRLRQLVYVSRSYSSFETVEKVDYDGRRGHGHTFLRPMNEVERLHYEADIVVAAQLAYVRSK